MLNLNKHHPPHKNPPFSPQHTHKNPMELAHARKLKIIEIALTLKLK